jgi:hypothetical protein
LFLKQQPQKYIKSIIQKKIIINRTRKFFFLNNFKVRNLSFFKLKKIGKQYFFKFKKNINTSVLVLHKNFYVKNSINFYFFGFNNTLNSNLTLSNLKNNSILFFNKLNKNLSFYLNFLKSFYIFLNTSNINALLLTNKIYYYYLFYFNNFIYLNNNLKFYQHNLIKKKYNTGLTNFNFFRNYKKLQQTLFLKKFSKKKNEILRFKSKYHPHFKKIIKKKYLKLFPIARFYFKSLFNKNLNIYKILNYD